MAGRATQCRRQPEAEETIVVTMLSRTRRGVPATLAAAGLAGTILTATAVPAAATSTSQNFSAALLAGGSVATWGSNDYGQLGDGTTHSRPAAAVVAGLFNITQISGGYGHMLAVDRNGKVWSWGNNDEGQLGNGTTSDNWAAPSAWPSASPPPGCLTSAAAPRPRRPRTCRRLASCSAGSPPSPTSAATTSGP
jgi:hypothetical protein